MVLDRSDYSIPSPGDSYDPTSANTYAKLAGAVVAFTMILFAFSFARNRALPFMNNLLASVGLSSQGSGSIEVFN